MSYSDQQVEDLKERADIVAVLGRRIQLKKTGKDHTGLCPFHGERTPSFYVIPNKHMWHCFGCGESGDIFKFFMKLDGMSFVNALKHVAGESGIILAEERHDPEEARRKAHMEELASLLDRAVRFYEQKLWHVGGLAAREHLKKRGIKEEFVRKFHIGFGGTGQGELAKALVKAGVSLDLSVDAGLCIKSRRGGDPFDRFQGRLIVPIRVPRPPDGRTIALGGRYLEGVTDAGRASRPDFKPAKYINSPETPLYQKGHVLFGLDQARDAIRKSEKAVIVEGYFDVIGVHQAGLQTAVATCGTSLTPNHLDLLMRSAAREIIFLFDGDDAGLRAAARAAEMCAKAQVPARVATLPTGLDPDEFARQKGLAALEALLERAQPAVEMLIDREMNSLGPNPTVEDRVRAVDKVRAIVLAAPEGLSRDLYYSQIAQRLGVTDAAVKGAITNPTPPPNRMRAVLRQPVDRGPRGPVGPRRAVPPTPPPPVHIDQPESADPSIALPPRAAPHQPQTVVNRRTLSAEESIALALLKFPVLSATVAQEGIIVDFGHPDLRALAEGVINLQQEGMTVEPESLLADVEDEVLRRRLRKSLVDAEATLEETATHLGRVLLKLQEQIDRGRARAAIIAGRESPAPTDEATVRANLEKAEEIHKLRKERHRRKRERDGNH